MNEVDLIHKAQDGDQEASAELFKAHRGRLTRLVSRILRNEADAEEVASDAFLNGLNTYKIDGGASFKTWLDRIAKNACRDMIRKNARWVSLDEGEEGGGIV